MDANSIAIGIEDHGHAANGRGHWLHAKFHVARAEVRDGGVKIGNFQRGGTAVGARVPAGRRADGQCVGTELVLHPLAARHVADGGWLQTKDAFIKCARSGHVRYGIAAECDFSNFEHGTVK